MSVSPGCQIVPNIEADIAGGSNKYSGALRVSQRMDLAPCNSDLASGSLFEGLQTLKNRLDFVFFELFPIEIVEAAVVGEKPL
jgi:hypothetical protein